jgi:hypothetical protein
LSGSFGQVEGLRRLAGLQHRGGEFVENVDLRRPAVDAMGRDGGAHVIEQREAFLKTRGREAGSSAMFARGRWPRSDHHRAQGIVALPKQPPN